MNTAHVSIGEMGGRGLGHWSGVPMAFLVREALELGKDLDAALAVFRDNKRTCEYYYVLADAKTKRGVGLEAHLNKFYFVQAGRRRLAGEAVGTTSRHCEGEAAPALMTLMKVDLLIRSSYCKV